MQNTRYLGFGPSFDKIIVSGVPSPPMNTLRSSSGLKSMWRQSLVYQFLVGMQHIDNEDSLVYEITHVTVRKDYIVAYRRLVTTADSKPREESTPTHIVNVAHMTATQSDTSPTRLKTASPARFRHH